MEEREGIDNRKYYRICAYRMLKTLKCYAKNTDGEQESNHNKY